MSSLVEIITGDDAAISVQLQKNGATFDISPASTVECQVNNKATGIGMLSAPAALRDNATGADWNTSLVVVELSEAETDQLTPGYAEVEIQVDDGNKTTFKFDVRVLSDSIA